MPADTLLAMSQRAASRGASRIYSIGDLPLQLAAPILVRVPTPAQLHEIELASPHIIGCIDDLWLAFLKRDIPYYESKPHRPANPASWFKVYKKLKKQAEADMTAGQDKLKAALGAIQKDKEQNIAQMVTRQDMPRGGTGLNVKQQVHYDYISGKTGAKGAHKMSLFDKIRKEKQDVRANTLRRPVARKPGMPVSVQAAPDRMVQAIVQERKRIEEDKRRDRAIAAAAVRAPRATAPIRATGSKDEVGYDLIADREARLRAMKTRQAVNSVSEPTSPPMAGQKRTADQAGLTADGLEDLFDDDELDSDDADDELFGHLPTTTTRPPAKKQRPEIIKTSTRKNSNPDLTPHQPPPASVSGQRKLLDPKTASNGVMDMPRGANPGGISSPAKVASPKPMVKRRPPPSLFHTPKRVAHQVGRPSGS